MEKSEILSIIEGGLKVFKHYLKKLIPSGRGYKANNPFRKDMNPSLSIYKDKNEKWYFRDMAQPDRYRGDCFDFIALKEDLDLNLNFPEILEIADKIGRDSLNNTIDKSLISSKSSITSVSSDLFKVEVESKDFTTDALEYWKQYGVCEEFLKSNPFIDQVGALRFKYKSGRVTDFTVPRNQMQFAFKGAGGIKVYTPEPKSFRCYNKKGDYYFEVNNEIQGETTYLVAGEKDAIVLANALNVRTVCLLSETATPSRSYRKSLYYDDQSTLKVLYDIDETGSREAKRLNSTIGIETIDLSSIVPESHKNEVKDVSDYIECGLSLELLRELLQVPTKQERQQWLEEQDQLKSGRFRNYMKTGNKFPSEIKTEEVEVIEEVEVLEVPEKVSEKVSEEIDVNHTQTETNERSELSILQSIVSKLPQTFQDIIEPHPYKMDKEVLLLGSLVTLSSIMPNVFCNYRANYFPPLLAFITAPASAGKGIIKWAEKLVDGIEDFLNEQYKQQYSNWSNEGSKNDPPSRKTLIIPGNSSIAAMTDQLSSNDGVGLIVETEADTLGNTMKQEWGDLSTIFRCAFEHETVRSLRKGKSVTIQTPKLAMILTGTRNQLFNVIPDNENGLFSRFIFFDFPLDHTWKKMFNSKIDFNEYYRNLSGRILEYWKKLQTIDSIEFNYTDEQIEKFYNKFSKWQSQSIALLGDSSASTIRRLAITNFRFAMIFSVVRMLDDGKLHKEIVCGDDDFEIAMQLTEVFLENASNIFQKLPSKSSNLRVLKPRQLKLYESLPLTFDFSEGLELASSLDIPKGTAEKYFRLYRESGLIVSEKHGSYRKLIQSEISKAS